MVALISRATLKEKARRLHALSVNACAWFADLLLGLFLFAILAHALEGFEFGGLTFIATFVHPGFEFGSKCCDLVVIVGIVGQVVEFERVVDDVRREFYFGGRCW